jgi:environmental stress-induced protein Ves
VRPSAAVQILRACERTAVPWKNGGGLTREVAVHPAGSGLDDFDWRVSIAEVRAGGPFSAFPGIERQMAVLSGRLVLSIAGGETVTLSPESPPLRFAGEAAVLAQPLQEPVTDLNLMTRTSRCSGRLTLRIARTTEPLRAAAHTTVLIALGPLDLAGQVGQLHLGVLDAVLIARWTHCEVGAAGSEGAAYYLAEIEFPS